MLAVDKRGKLATEITDHRNEIATYAVNEMVKTGYWIVRYGDQGRSSGYNDNLKNLDVFALSIRNGSPMIVDNHVLWLRDLFVNLGLCSVFLGQAFTYMQKAAEVILDDEAAKILIQTIERGKNLLAYTDALSQTLVKHQDSIVEIVVEEMYRSTPFWDLRYGERGRANCSIDTYYNIAYFIDALATSSTRGIRIHTGWMRNFLVSRGMCGHYYLRALEVLRDAMLTVLPADQHLPVQQLYKTVAENLQYDNPVAKIVEQKRVEILETLAVRHYDRTPRLQTLLMRYEYINQAQYFLSYWLDAVVLKKPEVFANYVGWLRSVLPQLPYTPHDINTMLAALHAALPAEIPADETRQWLLTLQTLENTPAIQLHMTAEAIWQNLHQPQSFWSVVIPTGQQTRWHAQLEGILAHILTQPADFTPILRGITQAIEPIGASRAYILDWFEVTQTEIERQLPATEANSIKQGLANGLAKLTEDDAALSLLQMPGLLDPVVQTMQSFSPYWQAQYQRRSQTAIKRDVRNLLGLIADNLMELTTRGLPEAADLQRHYLLNQGICTAYYQQLVDATQEIITPLLDSETAERARIQLGAASAVLESENASVLAMADKQDSIVDFVVDYLKQQHSAWVSHYPGGWEDATSDLYFWLAYLSDSLTFNQPGYLAGHVAWLYDHTRSQGKSGDPIRVTLIALGHGIKAQVPTHSAHILNMMKLALGRVNA